MADKIIKFPRNNMRQYIKLVEQADADDMYGDSSRLTSIGRQNGQEFSDRGRADINSKTNNPRFADNSMTDEPEKVNEFATDPLQLDQLQRELNRVGVDDVTIRQGMDLSHNGKQKMAAQLGVSIEKVDMLMAELKQNLEDKDARTTDNIIDDYYSTISEDITETDKKLAETLKKEFAHKRSSALKGDKKRPFDKGAMTERFSAERDYAGNVTVRDSKTGNEKFIQGAEATALLSKLDHGANPNELLAPLLEFVDDVKNHEHASTFAKEISASAGTYNFQWDYEGERGFATVFYRTDTDEPNLSLESVRDMNGDEVDDIEPDMHDALLQQAQDYIGHE